MGEGLSYCWKAVTSRRSLKLGILNLHDVLAISCVLYCSLALPVTLWFNQLNSLTIWLP